MVTGDEPSPPGGFAAKLTSAKNTPTEQRAKAPKTQGLKIPDLEVGFLFMMCDLFLFMGGNHSLAVSLAERRSVSSWRDAEQTLARADALTKRQQQSRLLRFSRKRVRNGGVKSKFLNRC